MDMSGELNKIAEKTLLQLREISGRPALSYDHASVIWLAGFIERQRQLQIPRETINGMVGNLGCYFGRCIIECYGGKWAESPDGWAVQFDEQNSIFPFNKLAKHFENGTEDSIRSMFEVIPTLYPNVRPQVASAARKPWWKLW